MISRWELVSLLTALLDWAPRSSRAAIFSTVVCGGYVLSHFADLWAYRLGRRGGPPTMLILAASIVLLLVAAAAILWHRCLTEERQSDFGAVLQP